MALARTKLTEAGGGFCSFCGQRRFSKELNEGKRKFTFLNAEEPHTGLVGQALVSATLFSGPM
jgi:hypothetical protein